MASSVIGALRVNLGLDSAEFQDGVKKAQGQANQFGAGLKTAFTAAAAAATAALGAVSIAVKRTIASANDLGDVADRLGVNIERLQEMRYAAERGGMSIQNFDVALRRFVRRSAEAAQGTGAAKNAFKELGVELRDNEGRLRSSDELLHDVADAMRNVQSPADKLRIAFQMFDTDGAAMVNVLANGSAGMKDLAAEAQRLGLVLSEETVRSSQAITDNFEMAGNVIGGLVNRLTAFLAPALVVVSEAVVQLALKLHGLVDVLPTIAEYAAVAGGSLAIMAAPAILAAVGNLTVAIGVGLVGAIRAVTAAMAANPLGALAIGIMIAVTAVYHFRDEIQKAIGVDVVAIVKDAANLVIGSFVAAFEDIKFVWNNFPAIIGAAVVGAANVTIKAIVGMVNTAVDLLNDLAAKANSWLPDGFQLGEIGKLEAGELQGPDISQALSDRNAAVDAALTTDYIGQLGAAFEASTPAVADFSAAMDGAAGSIANVGNAISGGGSGGGGGGAAEGAANGMLAGLEQLRQSLMTMEEAERNSYANRLIAIQEYYDAGLIHKAEYDDLMERAHQEHTDRMAEITRRGVEQEMRMREALAQQVGSVMGSISSILEKSGEKGLAASKAFAIGEAIINTAVGITQALRLPPPLSWAQAAAVAAAGAAQIATISSARKGSSRRPAVSGSGGASSGGGEVTRNDTPSGGTVNLQIQGLSRDSLYSGEQVRELMDKMVEMQRDGYQLVVVDT